MPGEFLSRLERHRPKSAYYFLRWERGGRLARRWKLILSDILVQPGESDERWPGERQGPPR